MSETAPGRIVDVVAAAGPPKRHVSALAPLRHPVYRSLWIAQIVSNVGTWMHEVGAAWLMTSFHPSPLLASLLQTASSLPVVALALPAGAVADVIDRRRILLATQTWMCLVAGLLGVLTLSGLATPAVLLAFTFAMGLGVALNTPAWQATIPSVVPREELTAAAALGSVGFNVARVVGPALGGLIVAAAGSWAVFMLNAASFLGTIGVLILWRTQPRPEGIPKERFYGALRAGFRFARHAPPLRSILVRTTAVVVPGSAVWALMPVVARRLELTSFQYGTLLGCLGIGAVSGAALLPTIRRRFSLDRIVSGGTIVWGMAAVSLAFAQSYAVLCASLALGGMGWIALMSNLNAAAQTALPAWVRARGLAFYILAFQGGFAVGGVVWGTIATATDLRTALLLSAAGLLAGLTTILWHPLESAVAADVTASLHWPTPQVFDEPRADDGPVLVTIEYRVPPESSAAFVADARQYERVRRRDGALQWGLFRDLEDPRRWLETFVVESWGEHLRQHERHTIEDRAIERRVRSHLEPGAAVKVSHLMWGGAANGPRADGVER
jgi:MFS family permease